ncbi:hypothetical protein [Streptomyces sp. NPDC012825]|uniref:hypothetical protein n=1 Tax=Streptomyces sp. NPDC012825 TaxID=3364851 RepID=UPI0036CB9826
MTITGSDTAPEKKGLADIRKALLEAKLSRQRAGAAKENRIDRVDRTGRLEVSDQQRHL